MKQHGHKARLTDRPESDDPQTPNTPRSDAGATPSWMEMLDPEARDARIAEAQRRRAEALAAKREAGQKPDAPTRAPRRSPIEFPRAGDEAASATEELTRIIAARRAAEARPVPGPVEASPPPPVDRPAPVAMPRPPVERAAPRLSDEERARRLADTRMAFVKAARAETARPVDAAPVPRPRLTPVPAPMLVPEPLIEEDQLIGIVADRRPIPKPRANRAPLIMIFFAGLCAGGIGVALALWLPGRPVEQTASGVPVVEQFAPSEPATVLGGVAHVDSRPRIPDVSVDRQGSPIRLAAPVADSDPLTVTSVIAPAPFLLPTPLAAVSGGQAVSVPASEDMRVASVDPAVPVAPAPELAMPADSARLATAPAPPAPAPAPASVAQARVFVHYPASAEAEAVDSVDALETAGVEAAKAMPVGFSVGKANIRYYHAEDRAAAEQVAVLMGEVIGSAPEARDFTDFRPSPNPGIIEVWLEGDAPAPVERRVVAPVAAAPAVRAPVAQARPRAVLANDQEAEEVHRLILERSVERMLREKTGAN